MSRPILYPAIAFSLLGLIACGDNVTPTQPSSADRPAPDAAAATVSNTWLTRADLPSTERVNPAVAVVRNGAGQSIVYVIGGYANGGISKVQAYNAVTNSWSYKASLPVPLWATNGAGVIGGKIYVSGGRTKWNQAFASLYVYDPATNRWSRKADMPNTSFDGVTGVIGGKLYVLTGCEFAECSPRVETAALYRYDPATDRWTTLRSSRNDGSPVQHVAGMAGVIGGKLYVTGSQIPRRAVTRLDVYNPATDTWASRAPLPGARWSGAGAVLGGEFYVIGGITETPDGFGQFVATTSVYHPATNTWTNRRPLPAPRAGIGGTALTVNGQVRIEVVGGPHPGNNLQYVP